MWQCDNIDKTECVQTPSTLIHIYNQWGFMSIYRFIEFNFPNAAALQEIAMARNRSTHSTRKLSANWSLHVHIYWIQFISHLSDSFMQTYNAFGGANVRTHAHCPSYRQSHRWSNCIFSSGQQNTNFRVATVTESCLCLCFRMKMLVALVQRILLNKPVEQTQYSMHIDKFTIGKCFLLPPLSFHMH